MTLRLDEMAASVVGDINKMLPILHTPHGKCLMTQQIWVLKCPGYCQETRSI
jgi:hypothetical protein